MSESLAAVIERHQDALLAIDGVTGIGESICQGKPCVHIYIAADDPAVRARLPEVLDGYPVEVSVAGRLRSGL